MQAEEQAGRRGNFPAITSVISVGRSGKFIALLEMVNGKGRRTFAFPEVHEFATPTLAGVTMV